MKKRIIAMCLAVTLVFTMLPQKAVRTYATQSDKVAYEVREEVIEFKLSNGTVYYTNTISYPYFLGNTAAENKINDKYSAIINEWRNNTTDFDAVYQENLQWNSDIDKQLPYYDDIFSEVTYNENGVISIKERSTMWSGGMHPYSDYTGHTYLISDGSELSLSEILVGSEKEKNSLVDQYKRGIIDYYDAERIIVEPFVLTGEGLCFICNVGDAVDRVEIVIPYCDPNTYVISAGGLSSEITADDALQYFIDKCDSRYFTEADILEFDAEACLYARNAIYAKAGWNFSDQKLKSYFQKYSWYTPVINASDFTEDMLNQYQIANRNLIVQYENLISEKDNAILEDESINIMNLPYIGDISTWSMSDEQAKAYEEVIRNSIERFESNKIYSYADDRAVYVTLIDIDGNTLLWLAGIVISNEGPEWPADIAFGSGSMQIVFEEIWEWDGSKAVEFDIVSEYGAHTNYYAEGFEVFTFYGGTDVDGEAWRALYPINNGNICRTPEWCYAWAWIYSYKLEDIDTSGLDKKGVAKALFSSMMVDAEWPALPFDWDTIELPREFSSSEYYAEVTGGHGFTEFCNSKSDQYGYWPESTSKAIQCAAYIAKQDGTWKKAEGVADFLNEYTTRDESAYEDYAHSEWIKQHMEYASSDEYEEEVVGGYSNRMMAVFRDALDDEDIKSYETRKAVCAMLNLDIELSEADMYELIIAEILYGERGQYITEETYNQNLRNSVTNVAKVLVNMATSGDTAKEIPADMLDSIKELYELLQTLEFGSEEYGTTYSKFISLLKGNITDLKSKLKTELAGDAAFTGLGIVIDGAFEQYEALEDILSYINNYVAYQSTSKQTQEVLAYLAVNVLYKYDGLYGVDEFIGELGLWDSMTNWADFQTALISVMKAMAEYEQEGADAIAEFAVEREREAGYKFGAKALKSVTVFVVEKAASCVPVINTILLVKNVANVVISATVILDQVFTNVDEREYALDILTKAYCISVMLDKTVDDCVDSMSEDDFYSTTVFDESVSIYKKNLMFASAYALKYADMVLANAEEALREYDEGWSVEHLFTSRDELVSAVAWYSNSYKLLEEQQVEIQEITCHDSNLQYNPVTDEIIYNFRDSRIYIIACPVEVIVTTDTGEQIAYLSGEENQIASGYEFYFHTIKLKDDSGEYIKVAIVPDEYKIELKGTDDGVMHAFVTDFVSGDVGEVETYFNIPIEKNSVGYFEVISDDTNESHLVMDQVAYFNMESADDIPTTSESKGGWIWIVSGVIACGVILIIIHQKKSRK